MSIFSSVSFEEYSAPSVPGILYIPMTLSPEKYPDSSFSARPSETEAEKTESVLAPLSM